MPWRTRPYSALIRFYSHVIHLERWTIGQPPKRSNTSWTASPSLSHDHCHFSCSCLRQRCLAPCPSVCLHIWNMRPYPVILQCQYGSFKALLRPVSDLIRLKDKNWMSIDKCSARCLRMVPQRTWSLCPPNPTQSLASPQAPSPKLCARISGFYPSCKRPQKDSKSLYSTAPMATHASA